MNRLITTLFSFFVIFVLFTSLGHAAGAQSKETPHYDVVAEYVQSLGAVHRIQQTSIKEFQEDDDKANAPFSKMLSAIRGSTRMKLELRRGIGALKQMRLKEPFEELIPNTIFWYEKKIALHDEIIKIAKTLTGTEPKPGVDYSEIMGKNARDNSTS